MSIFGDGRGERSPLVDGGRDGGRGIVPGDLAAAAIARGLPIHLNRMETYVLLEAARAPKGVLELEQIEGPEEAKFTAAKRLELDGLVKLLGPSTYQITRKGRDPKLLADMALEWIRKRA